MKVFILLFIISTISLSLSKKRKHHNAASSPEPITRSLTTSESQEYEELKDVKENKSYKNDKLNYKGTFRQMFAIVTAYSDPRSNVVCSPVSALLPLGKLALGAKNKSYKELLKMVGEKNTKKLSKSFKKLLKHLKFTPGVKLDLASRIYVSDKSEINSEFMKTSKDVFESGVGKVSFENPKEAVDEINEWVSKQTKGMISELLSPTHISPDTSLVIVNAIYLKGRWKNPFTNIQVSDFQSPMGPKKVQLMSRPSTYYNYTKSVLLNSQIIEIPYEGSETSFIIVLPTKTLGLPLLLYQLALAPSLLNTAMEDMVPTEVALSIPKFKITTSLDLKEMYKKIGIKYILRTRSGLKGIVEDEELTVSSAIQKAVIEVHEKGTEAAAASAFALTFGAAPMLTEQFRADHPFLFYIQTNREQLFSGILNEP